MAINIVTKAHVRRFLPHDLADFRYCKPDACRSVSARYRRMAQKRKQKSAVPVTPAKQVVSRQAQRNREKAMAMNKGFVLFLTAVSIAVLFTCINYLQVKSEITASMKNVANLESELAQLKEDNDAYYSQVTSAVDISEIKKKAIGELGMKYPSEDQIQTYTTEGNSYVRQYQDVDTHK